MAEDPKSDETQILNTDDTRVMDTASERSDAAEQDDTEAAEQDATVVVDQDATRVINAEEDDTRVMDTASERSDAAEDVAADSDLPELNFDPAEEPSTFDPRVTGEGASDSDLPELNFDPAEEPSAFDPRVTGEGTGKIELPEQAPSSWDEVDPFEDVQQPGPEATHSPDAQWPAGTASIAAGAQHPGAQGTPSNTETPQPGSTADTATTPAKRSVKFGLLTWSLIMIVIGVAIIAMPWWGLIDWPVVGAITFGTMGVFMLVIALIALFSEKKHRND
ncbi:MAG: hypothetical protein Q4D87_09070 [Actinomycetaceae bacterium]|nr:hypothetical protein [Actinomycetaceae bacterium]